MIDFPAEKERIRERVSSPVDVSGAATGRTAFPAPIGIEVIDHIRDRLAAIVCIGRGALDLSKLIGHGCEAYTNGKYG